MSTHSFPAVMPFESGAEIDVEIEFWYTPYEPESWGFDGGTPAVPESIEDVEVISDQFRGRYITKFLTDDQKKWAEDEIEKYIQREKEKAEAKNERDRD